MRNYFRIPSPLSLPVSLLALLLLCAGLAHAADERHKPFILSSNEAGDVAEKLAAAKQALQGQGFTIAGEYSPYDGAHVVVVTSDELQKLAAQSEFGGYGAMQRIGVTKAGDKVQVAYTNPLYMQHIYRMKGDLSGIAGKLEAALGKQEAFGSANGLTAAELKDYHYMVFMPYFTDQVEVAKYDNYEAAVQAVDAGLSAGKGGTAKVYRIDLPGKQESVFGVALKQGDGADKKVMGTIDTTELRHTPHLPYEVLVSGGGVYMLHGKFRIAQSFPDLTMGTFMNISDAPAATERSMLEVAGKK